MTHDWPLPGEVAAAVAFSHAAVAAAAAAVTAAVGRGDLPTSNSMK